MDGDVLDLGGVTVRFVQAPGHTPGIFAFFIPEDDALVIGDICDENVLLFDEHSSSVSGYLACLEKLAPFIERSRHLLGSHGEFAYSRELIENVRESCARILDGTDARFPVTAMGQQLLSANPVDAALDRTDGAAGNVLYTPEKAR